MMNNLTEQYKKGELENCKEYYTKSSLFGVTKLYLSGLGKWQYNSHFVERGELLDLEVLAKVPTYEEHQALIAENDRFRNALEDIAYCKTWYYQNQPSQLVTWALEGLAKIGNDLSCQDMLDGKKSKLPYRCKLAEENTTLKSELAKYKEDLENGVALIRKLSNELQEQCDVVAYASDCSLYSHILTKEVKEFLKSQVLNQDKEKK